MKGDAMKAIGYIRVSTEDQAREGISLDNQKAKIKAWADLNNYELQTVYCDAGISGKDMDSRDGLQKALDCIGNSDALVVYSLSRLTRSTRDTLDIADYLKNRGADLVSISEKIETNTAAGKMVFRMLAVLNEFERDQISERTKQVLSYKKSKGEWMGRIPFGFKIKDNYLVEDPEQIKIIQKAKRLKRAGKSIRDIARAVNLSVGYVHKILNVNLRTVKALYCNGLQVAVRS